MNTYEKLKVDYLTNANSNELVKYLYFEKLIKGDESSLLDEKVILSDSILKSFLEIGFIYNIELKKEYFDIIFCSNISKLNELNYRLGAMAGGRHVFNMIGDFLNNSADIRVRERENVKKERV